MTRQPHQEGVGFAGLEVQELQNLLLMSKEKATQCLGLVIAAVGEDPTVESARMAVAWSAGMVERIDELLGQCEQIKAELNRYGAGF